MGTANGLEFIAPSVGDTSLDPPPAGKSTFLRLAQSRRSPNAHFCPGDLRHGPGTEHQTVPPQKLGVLRTLLLNSALGQQIPHRQPFAPEQPPDQGRGKEVGHQHMDGAQMNNPG